MGVGGREAGFKRAPPTRAPRAHCPAPSGASGAPFRRAARFRGAAWAASVATSGPQGPHTRWPRRGLSRGSSCAPTLLLPGRTPAARGLSLTTASPRLLLPPLRLLPGGPARQRKSGKRRARTRPDPGLTLPDGIRNGRYSFSPFSPFLSPSHSSWKYSPRADASALASLTLPPPLGQLCSDSGLPGRGHPPPRPPPPHPRAGTGPSGPRGRM